MKTSETFRCLLIVGIPLITFPSMTRTLTASDLPVCDSTAETVRKAAEQEANADFWLAVATCLNGSGDAFPSCLDKARSQHEEALDLAREQYDARLEACELLGNGPYDPQIDPSDFSPTVDNEYFPLVPRRTLVYESQTDEGLERDEVTTLDETAEIDGVECRADRDRVTLDGELIEDTTDWYAQNRNEDVWYFGEVAQNFVDGFLDNLDGSWRTGTEGAEPGILMLDDPVPDDVYRQEFLVNEAEDIARVISLDETVHVPYGTFDNCLETEEWSPLEPGVFEHKFYAPEIGLVLEINPESGERLELVEIIDRADRTGQGSSKGPDHAHD